MLLFNLIPHRAANLNHWGPTYLPQSHLMICSSGGRSCGKGKGSCPDLEWAMILLWLAIEDGEC